MPELLPDILYSDSVVDAAVSSGVLVVLPNASVGGAIWSQSALENPPIAGGDLGLTIDGVTRTGLMRRATARASRSVTSAGGCDFELFDQSQTFKPVLDQEVILSDAGERLFGGYIDKITEKYMHDGTESVWYAVSCTDWSSITDRRVVARSYPPGSHGTEIALDIINNFLDGEGFSVHVQGGYQFYTDEKLEFNYVTVRQALDSLAQLTGDRWFITPEKEIFFYWPVLLGGTYSQLAPFNITQTSANYSDLSVEYSKNNMRTREFVRSNVNLQVGTFVEEYTVQGDYQSMFPTVFPLLGKPTLTLDGVSQTVLELGVDPPNRDAWYYLNNGYGVWHGQTRYVPRGTVAVVSYGSFLSNVVQVQDDAAIALYGRIDVVDEIRDVDSVAMAEQIARGILDRYKSVDTVIKYTTYFPGLKPGMAQTVNISSKGISETFWITQIESDCEVLPLPQGSYFRHSVTLSNTYGRTDPYGWFRTLWNRTKQGKVDPQSEIHGWTLSGDVQPSTTWKQVPVAPVTFQEEKFVYQVVGVMGTAPVGHSVELDIRKASTGGSIFETGTVLRLGASPSSAVRVNSFADPPNMFDPDERYQLWMRSVPTEGATTTEPAADINIQLHGIW